jgi:chromosome segregation ATPase
MMEWPWKRSERGLHKRASDTEERVKEKLRDVESQIQKEISGLSSQLVVVMKDIQAGAQRSEKQFEERLEAIENSFPKFKKVVVDLRGKNQVLQDRVAYLENKIFEAEFMKESQGYIEKVNNFISKYNLIIAGSIMLLIASLGFCWLLMLNV